MEICCVSTIVRLDGLLEEEAAALPFVPVLRNTHTVSVGG